jgi:uncharacterized lipoprotein YddW (UPF0748 family)
MLFLFLQALALQLYPAQENMYAFAGSQAGEEEFPVYENGCLCRPQEKRKEKPKYLWVDASANYYRFLFKSEIVYYLDKAKETGFNHIIVDVRPGTGDVLYNSRFLQEYTGPDDTGSPRGWDYLQFWIDEAAKREMKVSASVTVFPAGNPKKRTGVVYRGNTWDGKTCRLYKKTGQFMDVKDDNTKVAAFLNPCLPEVQDYCLRFIKEIVQDYDIAGLTLDYCRYLDSEADFSQATQDAFEEYLGQTVLNFPEGILSWSSPTAGFPTLNPNIGDDWVAFRSKVIRDFIARARKEIKAMKPEVKVEYWAAAWYAGLWGQGQNWASPGYDPSSDPEHTGYRYWASPRYKEAGFADQLDIFINGIYYDEVYGKNNPSSMEYGLNLGKKIIKGDNLMVGSIYAVYPDVMEEGAYICLTQSGGLMVFDIVQVIQFDLWDELKRGIERAERDLNSE